MPQHIRRLISVFVVFIVLFVILQQALKPNSFGEFGHYRGEAIKENEMHEMHYAGKEKCSECHDDIWAEKAEGYHAKLYCEGCHGPGLKHAMYADKFADADELPDSLKLHIPGERKDCALCHQKNAARTKIQFDTIDNSMLVQIDAMEHNYKSKKTGKIKKCTTCHNPHQP